MSPESLGEENAGEEHQDSCGGEHVSGKGISARAQSAVSAYPGPTVLKELEKQAKATGRIQTTLQEEVEGLKDSLERERTFGIFIRTRIAQHLDSILAAMNDIGTLSRQVAKRSWVESGSLAITERTMDAQINSIKLNAGILLRLNAIPEPLHGKLLACVYPLASAWDNLISELTTRDPNFRKQYPNTPEFSPSRFNDLWGQFLQACDKLQESVLDLPASLLIPK